MSKAIFDFKCAAHGVFESTEPGRCPYGCGAGMVEKIWLQAPGFMSDKTKTTDSSKKALAKQFGMTDVQSRAGRPAMPDTYRWNDASVLGTGENAGVGKPYSVELDHSETAADVRSQAAAQGAAEDGGHTFETMKQNGQVKFKTNVVAIDPAKVTPSQIQEAE